VLSCDNNTANNPIENHISGILIDAGGNLLANKSIGLDYHYPSLNRPSTTINFNLDSSVNVNLWIEDNCHNLVKTLISNTFLEQGSHSIDWNATDETGNVVVSGNYYLNLEIGDELLINDMHLVLLYEYYESIEGMNTFATTDENGFFSISMECLIFDKTYTMTTEFGEILGEYTIPYEVKLSFFDAEQRLFTTDFLDVNPYGKHFYILIPEREIPPVDKP